MKGYLLHKAVREILQFTMEDLSRWYIQLIRPRTWIEADDPDKLALLLCALRSLHNSYKTDISLYALFG